MRRISGVGNAVMLFGYQLAKYGSILLLVSLLAASLHVVFEKALLAQLPFLS